MSKLLTRETARKRAARDYQVVYRLLLIAQAEALEWAAEFLREYEDDLLAVRLDQHAARLRKEAE